MLNNSDLRSGWDQNSTEFRTDRYSRRVSHAVSFEEFSKRGISTLTSARDFIGALRQLRVRGPFALLDRLNSSNLVGVGGQASVFQGYVSGLDPSESLREIYKVAIKKSHVRLEENNLHDIQDDRLKSQVHDMYLEILALCQHNLRKHRNIMRLIGWTTEIGQGSMPLLILALADRDLSTFVMEDVCNAAVQQHLCLDVACGLEALHSNGIIHGDLKPGNVLVRLADKSEKSTPFIAVLADFGFSVMEAEFVSKGQIDIKGFTPKWCAPEVLERAGRSHDATLSTKGYQKADIYCLGLVMWDIVSSGNSLDSRVSATELASVVALQVCQLERLGQEFLTVLSAALSQLLQYEPSLRPENPLLLLRNSSDSYESWYAAHIAYHKSEQSVHANPIDDRQNRTGNWQIPRIDHYSMQSIEKTFDLHGHQMTPAELFTLFLRKSAQLMGSTEAVTIESSHIKALLLAAEREFVPAQAVIYRVCTSFDIAVPETSNLIDWLYNGASTGCEIAMQDLTTLENLLARECQLTFRLSEVDLPIYLDAAHKELWASCKTYIKARASLSAENLPLHNLERPKEIIPGIRGQDISNERILILACTAGCARTVLSLFKLEPSCTAIPKYFTTTHLHWLHNFPEADMGQVADAMIGAINVVDNSSIVRRHYPYVWPPGTPLHRAVSAGNRTAVRVLLDRGADPSVRNGQDPYLYDLNERFLEGNVDPNDDPVSNLSCQTEGLTPLDIAVANLDWEIIEIFADYEEARAKVNAADEEGYAAFHRLQYGMVQRTSNKISFSQKCFLGSRTARISKKLKIIQALQRMGGNINQLTFQSNHNETAYMREGNFSPLMLASRRGDFEMVSALLTCGADAKARNSEGLTALCRLPSSSEPFVETDRVFDIVQILLEHGVDPNTGPYSRDIGLTPLQAASRVRSLQSIRLLLESGADPLARSKDVNSIAIVIQANTSYWYLAQPKDDAELIEQMLRDILAECLFRSASPSRLEDLLENVDARGGSLLHYAVSSGHTLCVKGILAQGANPNIFRPLRSSEAHPQESGYSKRIPWGTPLDCVLEIRHRATASLKRKKTLTELQKKVYQKTFEALDDIEALLLQNGGRFMRPIGGLGNF